MNIRDSQTATVKARCPWNHTGIQQLAGERYTIKATGRWVDWFLSLSPQSAAAVALLDCNPLNLSPGLLFHVEGDGQGLGIFRDLKPRSLNAARALTQVLPGA